MLDFIVIVSIVLAVIVGVVAITLMVCEIIDFIKEWRNGGE